MSRDRVSDALEDLHRAAGVSLDPRLWSANERKLFLELLQGPSNDAPWKNELRSVESHRKRWNAILNDAAASMDYPFKWRHAEVARRARRSPPIHIEQIVTGFTNWIFGLYESKRDARKLELGRQLEREVVARRIPVPEHSRWKLEYDGTSRSKQEPLSIPSLLVNGQALRGKPDLVFREKKANRVVIVDIKISNAFIPSDGWPNSRAQLWAYSKADWRASEIILATEVWAMETRLRHRKTLVRNASDATLNRQCSELFDIYCKHAADLGAAPAFGA